MVSKTWMKPTSVSSSSDRWPTFLLKLMCSSTSSSTSKLLRCNSPRAVFSPLLTSVFQVTHRLPARFFRDVEGVVVGILDRLRDPVLGQATVREAPDEPLALLIEQVAAALQVQGAEDEVLVLRRLHVPAQLVAGAEEEGGQLGEREFGHIWGLIRPGGSL